ncbi:MAG: hypothetical protein ACE5FI_18350 [Anaerolineales bacterium]
MPVDLHNFGRRHWGPALLEAGVAHRPFRVTRHTFVTWQLRADKSLADVAAYCGTSVAMLVERYLHVTFDHGGDEWGKALESPERRRLKGV